MIIVIVIVVVNIIIINCWNSVSYELFEASDLAVNSNRLLLQEKHHWIVLLLLCNTRCEISWKKVTV